MITEDVYLGPGEGIEWDEYPVRTQCKFGSLCFKCRISKDCYFNFKSGKRAIRILHGVKGRNELDAYGHQVRRHE